MNMDIDMRQLFTGLHRRNKEKMSYEVYERLIPVLVKNLENIHKTKNIHWTSN